MNSFQKIALGIVAIGLATALLLPGRQTPQVIGAGTRFFTGSLHTAITGQN